MSVFDELSPPYSTVVADPPWGYEEMTAPWRSTSTKSYGLMSHAEIASLPVGDIAAPDAHLYLWAVLPLMAEAYQVVGAWGFEADGTAVWWGIRHRCPEGTPCRDDAERALATRHFGRQSDLGRERDDAEQNGSMDRGEDR